jgi:hypothetical protein
MNDGDDELQNEAVHIFMNFFIFNKLYLKIKSINKSIISIFLY